MENNSIVQIVFNTSAVIKDNRNQYTVLASLMEEVGEFALEVNIANGASYKKEGEDGVVGEAIDIIAVALDAIYLAKPDITEQEIKDFLKRKCTKWKNKNLQYVIENGND